MILQPISGGMLFILEQCLSIATAYQAQKALSLSILFLLIIQRCGDNSCIWTEDFTHIKEELYQTDRPHYSERGYIYSI